MECIKLIRDLCKLPSGMTVNGETTADVNNDRLEMLRKYELMGFIQLRNKP
ncbi:MAG: hypothetical protein ACLSCE_10440 [Bacteroides cellulosilyticus]|uniref:hypothetical protein n=1 Tax=Bacteroides TaxID=816 RepID=UPI001E65B772|nr:MULTISPECIES: hypothetical protein [Bacteroides]UWZ89018.1 hypothetical protein NWT25_22195 [Bacteroides cellulosilyticus]